jgi:hypothetical protein
MTLEDSPMDDSMYILSSSVMNGWHDGFSQEENHHTTDQARPIIPAHDKHMIEWMKMK